MSMAHFHYDDYISKMPEHDSKRTVLTIGNVQSGKTRFMINETKRALNGDYDVVILLGGTNNMLLSQSYKRFNQDLRDTGFPVYEIGSLPIRGLRGTKKIITSLKGKKALEKLRSIIEETVNKKIMIFDDESDFASVNTSNDSFTPVFLLVRSLYENMEKGTFVSVTATPFADILSEDGFEFDEIIRLKPNEGYKGLVDFNNSEVYKIIDLEDFRKGRNIREWVKILIGHIKTISDERISDSQFLVNTSLNKKDHRAIKEQIYKILLVIKSQRISLLFPDSSKEQKMSYIDNIDILLNNIYVLNQENGDWDSNVNSIVIGGSLVSRGYTFPNLITTLMFNIPAGFIQADTFLQRARWFGYRDNFELMSVYMPSKLKNAYKEMEELNKIIFNDEYTLIDMENKIKELNLGIIQPSGKI